MFVTFVIAFGSGKGQGQGKKEKEGGEAGGGDDWVEQEEEEEEVKDGLHGDLTVRGGCPLVLQPKPKLWQRHLRRDCAHERVGAGLLRKQTKLQLWLDRPQMYQTSEYLEPEEGLEMFDPHQVWLSQKVECWC